MHVHGAGEEGVVNICIMSYCMQGKFWLGFHPSGERNPQSPDALFSQSHSSSHLTAFGLVQ